MNIKEHLEDMSDDELKAAFKTAESDLSEAAAQEPNSDWHGSCFAGLLVLGQEMLERGIRLSPLH